MPKKSLYSKKSSLAEADVPELDKDWFAGASVYQNGVLVKRGRPPLKVTKQAVKLRLDRDVIAGFKLDGPGWQTRINQALREWLLAHPATSERAGHPSAEDSQ